jgi:histidyl-tRNA synthetase
VRTPIQAVRGMNDILPPQSFLWQRLEGLCKQVFQSAGFQEIIFPIVEKTDLFVRTIGQTTDIVQKEMYTFQDRNGDSLTLRPEGTACCVRVGLEHGLLHNQVQRLWYRGPFFRHERPQKGRYRQFYQCSAEVFGLEGPDIDAELINLSALLLDKLGVSPFIKLQINTLGSSTSRAKYREALINYFKSQHHLLDEESLQRLNSNPLRILDSKNPSLKNLIVHAPKLQDYLEEEAVNHFEKLQNYLNHLNITFEVNPYLVRGLDYYNKTVFEWVTDHLGAQGTICAGGRYDSLVEQLGGKPTFAIGFSLGMERTLLLMEQASHHKIEFNLHAYLITETDTAFIAGLKLANYLRNKVHGLRLVVHCGGGSLKNQFKKADKSGAIYAIIIGDHELKTRSVSLKPLRETIPQQSLYQDELAEFLKLNISKK